MASSDEETLHILESLISDFYSGSTSNERKREFGDDAELFLCPIRLCGILSTIS